MLPAHARRSARALISLLAALLMASTAAPAAASTGIGYDPWTSGPGYHRTAVEPDTYAAGDTLVSGFQLGRSYSPGARGAGWATYRAGAWRRGILPGITRYQGVSGVYDRVSDAVVAYDARRRVWLISTLGMRAEGSRMRGAAILVSRSTDGGVTWGRPVTVAYTASADYDKNWIVCDNTPTSPYYGRCYVQFDVLSSGDAILMSRSSDGGLHWSTPSAPAGGATGVGGQPLVQPNGNVIVPIANASITAIRAFRSTNGGVSWSSPVAVSAIRQHKVHGGLRAQAFPSAEIDRTGRVYVAWQDCRFQPGCAVNDIVISTSVDGVSWSPVRRVPAHAVGSTVDHFIPGIGVDRTTSGSTARIGLTYFYLPTGKSCDAASCRLQVGFISSTDGGRTWSSNVHLAGPMYMSWLPPTYLGRMAADYISTSFIGGKAAAVYPLASAPSGGLYSMHMRASMLYATGGAISAAP